MTRITQLVVGATVILAATRVPAVEVTRAKADELVAALSKDDPWEAQRDGSALAWNEAYTIHAMVDLYEATDDPKYLREVVWRGDRMLSHRDDRINQPDYSGKVHKRWSIASKYTVGEVTLPGDDGRPAILLRSTLFAYNHLTDVEVTRTGQRFTIHLTNRHWKRDETFADLSADPTDPRYFEKIINDPKPRARPFCDPGTCTEASQLLVARPATQRVAPTARKVSLKPLRLAHVGYTGIIYHPLLRFALLVHDRTELQGEFNEPAHKYEAAARESYADIRENWRDGPGKDEGYYLNSPRGSADAYDNIGHAFNYLGKLASSELILFQLTGDPIYRDHVERIATLFKRRLTLVDNRRYVWDYWYEPVTTGWTRKDNISANTPHHAPWLHIEDTSHGALEAEMAANAAKAGIVFNSNDIQRLATTFTEKAVLPDRSGFAGHVDGTDPQSGYKGTRITGWLPLAAADRTVYDTARQVYENRGRDDLRELAALLKYQRVLDIP